MSLPRPDTPCLPLAEVETETVTNETENPNIDHAEQLRAAILGQGAVVVASGLFLQRKEVYDTHAVRHEQSSYCCAFTPTGRMITLYQVLITLCMICYDIAVPGSHKDHDVPFANVFGLVWPAFVCPVVLVVVVRASDWPVRGGKAVGLLADVGSPRGDSFPPHVLVAQQVRVTFNKRKITIRGETSRHVRFVNMRCVTIWSCSLARFSASKS